MSKKSRTSNFELFRIVSMFLIIAGHLTSEGGVLENVTGVTRDIVILMGSGARIAVNLFIMIGCWFMVDSKFSSRRILKLYSETWIYSAIITVVLWMLKVPISGITLVKSFLPFLYRTIWFSSVYIVLILLSPFLQKAFTWTRECQKKMLIVLFVLVSGVSTVNGFMDTYFCAIVWFVFVFLFIGYFKHFLVNSITIKKQWLLFAGIVIYLLAILGRVICSRIPGTIFIYGDKVLETWLKDYKSIPNFLCSILIFAYACKLDLGVSKVINFFANGAFGAYIIHQVPIIRSFLWQEIYGCLEWPDTPMIAIYYLVTIVSFYCVAVVIDFLRQKAIEPLLLDNRLAKRICELGDSFMNVGKSQ